MGVIAWSMFRGTVIKSAVLFACAWLTPATAAQPSTVWDDCFQGAGEFYGISPVLLKAIAIQESSLNPLAKNRNTNGTWDIGLLQINQSWWERLQAFGIRPEDLWDACVSIYAGAWILAQNIHQYGYNWKAVGTYNAGTSKDPKVEARRNDYARRVNHHLHRLPERLRDP